MSMNLSQPDIGPRYNIASTRVYTLGPSFYNIREGEELALVCSTHNNNNINNIRWRKKVSIQVEKFQRRLKSKKFLKPS